MKVKFEDRKMKCPRCGVKLAKRIHCYYCENKHCNIGMVKIEFKNLLQELRQT